MTDMPTYNPAMPREEQHEACQRQGHINSFMTGKNVSGHDFVQIGGEGINAVLECRMCKEISK